MPAHQIVTREAPIPTAPYSQAVRAGDYLFVAGQGPITKEGVIVRGTIAEQTRLTLQNIAAVLHAAGATLRDVVRVSSHLSELNEQTFQEYNEAYRTFFREEPLPARITVGSRLLGIDVEIEVVAYVGPA